MILIDVNVLVYANRRDAHNHSTYRRWLNDVVNSDGPYGIPDLVLSGFLRIVTHPKIFAKPTRIDSALDFTDRLRRHPNCVHISPGPRHWEIFGRLCRTAGVKGNLVPDAYLAALAIESGSEWITTDRDFARFPGLRWRLPFTDGEEP